MKRPTRQLIWAVASALTLHVGSLVAQTCNVSISAVQNPLCKGEDAIFLATGAIQNVGSYSFDFNTGTMPPGWSFTGQAQFTAPCGPSPDNTSYYWAATSSGTPMIETVDLDVSGGGTIDFEFIMSAQGGSSPCEGPDQANEGFELQYSINGGGTWVPITYFSPGGYQLPQNPNTTNGVANGQTPYTVWNTVAVPIPPAAQTSSTRFRWIQQFSSGTCCDNWGLDNVVINAGSLSTMTWSTGLTGPPGQVGSDTIQALMTDTCIIVTLTDTSGLSCTDTVCVQVVDLPTANASFTSPVCAGTQIPITGSISTPSGGISSYLFDFDNNGVFETTSSTGDVVFPNPIAGEYIVPFRVISSGGCEHDTTLTLRLNPNPTISITLNPTQICQFEEANINVNATMNNPPGFSSTVDSLQWDYYNSGQIDTITGIQNNTHKFVQSGTITVKVTAVSNEGCVRSATRNITVLPSPIADVLVEDVCIGQPIVLVNNSTVDAPDVFNTIDWETNGPSGNQTSTSFTPNFVFSTSGQHTLSLALESSSGCRDSLEVQFDVFPGIQPLIDYMPICFNEVLLYNASSGGSGDLYAKWTLPGSSGDTIIMGPDTLFFIYPASGTQEATLEVTDTNGCRIDTTMNIDVVGPIVLNNVPNVLIINPTITDNDKLDFEAIQPGFNYCYDYVFTVYNRWGVAIYTTENKSDSPDINCSACFEGKTPMDVELSNGTYFWTIKGNRDLELNGKINVFKN
ncbi:MAG: gliding motility-associated C-terminal domain-containing protein [Bacteroidetes bacterium]|nr:gliding motility-associated C-terminal domain-containing protein [Bacteroidota bacterium]